MIYNIWYYVNIWQNYVFIIDYLLTQSSAQNENETEEDAGFVREKVAKKMRPEMTTKYCFLYIYSFAFLKFSLQ